jgi:CBS domain-containing protein
MKVRELMRGEVITLREDDALSLALQIMGWNGVRHLPVVRDGRVVGMLSDRDVLARADVEHAPRVDGTAGEAMSAPVHVAPQHMDAEEAAAIMVRERVDALPVVDAGELVGIVTSTDLLGYVARCDVMPPPSKEPTVATLMIRRIEAVYPDHPLTEAAARMVAHGIRHLPVVDGMMRVVGILSERDVREVTGRSLLELEDAERTAYVQRLRVDDVMTREPRTLLTSAPLSTAVRALVEDRFGALPIVDDQDRLLGILSYVDLLRYLGARLGEDAGRRPAEARA